MNKGTETLDELLSEPIIRLLMARDRVRPEDVRMLLSKAQHNAAATPKAHVIDQCSQGPGAHA